MKKNKQAQNNYNLITGVHPQSSISEQYRTLRTTIDFMTSDQKLKSILVISAEAFSGKSETIGNLAVTLSQQGKKVLLIDADLRKPEIHRFFHLANQTGLTNVLLKQDAMEGSLQKTNVTENLSILTSGPLPSNPSECVGSSAMKHLLTTAVQNFEIVLIDAPSVTEVTDAQVLSRFVDGIIVVARANQTGKKELTQTKKLLNQVQANILGVVLQGGDKNNSSYYTTY